MEGKRVVKVVTERRVVLSRAVRGDRWPSVTLTERLVPPSSEHASINAFWESLGVIFRDKKYTIELGKEFRTI